MSQAPDFNSIGQMTLDSRAAYAALQADKNGFNRMAALLREHAGINLPENQKNLGLMASRTLSTMRSHGCQTYGQYLIWLGRAGQTGINEFVECMTTNTTEFFREPAHFDILRDLTGGRGPRQLSQDRLANKSEIRIWCAAASSGQEPYTILMSLLAELEIIRQFPEIKFLATDIDRSMLDHASRGIYSQSEVRSLPSEFQRKWFRPLASPSDENPRFLANQTLRDSITFAPLNLFDTPYPFKHLFDVIFCRNVLIYFDRPTSEKVVAEMARHLRPGGFLFLGHSEAGVIRPDNMKAVANAVYRKDS